MRLPPPQSSHDADLADEARVTHELEADGIPVAVTVARADADTALTATLANVVPPERQTVGPVFDLGPSGTHFSSPAAISWRVEPDDFPADVLLPMAEVLTSQHGERWRRIDTELDGLDDLHVTATAEHFSLFALVTDNSPRLVSPVDATARFDAGPMDVTTSAPVSVSGGVVTSGHVALLVAADGPGTTTVTFELGGLLPNREVYAGGLLPNREVYAYVGSYDAMRSRISSGSGDVTFELEVRPEPTLVLFRSDRNTLGIEDDGGACSSVGEWNRSTRVCTLTQDISDEVELRAANITLDCDGHRVSQPGLGPTLTVAQRVNGRAVTDVVVRDCTVRTGSGFGIFSAGRDVTLENVDARSPDSAALSAFPPDGLQVASSTLVGELAVLATSFDQTDTGATIRDSVILGGQGLQLGLGGTNDIVVDGNRIIISGAGNDVEPGQMYGVQTVGSLGSLSLRENRFEGRSSPSRAFAGVTRSSLVPSEVAQLDVLGNRLDGFEHGIILRDVPSVDLAYNRITENGTGLRIDEVPSEIAVYLNDIHGNDEIGVASDAVVELSDQRAGSPTFQRGNFWGYGCDETDFFVEGTDADAGVTDSHPFGVPVASLFGLDESAIPLPPGCDQLNLTQSCLDLQASPRETGGACDADGDGLLDHEEVFGADVVDADGNPLGHVDYPGMGANPLVPDIFVEADYVDRSGMHLPDKALNGQVAPTAEELRPVVEAFARNGIQLHIDLAELARGTKFDLDDGTQTTARIEPTDLIWHTDPRPDPNNSAISYLRYGPPCGSSFCNADDVTFWTLNAGCLEACARDDRDVRSEYSHPARRHGFKYVVYGVLPGAPVVEEKLAEAASAGDDTLTVPECPGEAFLATQIAEIESMNGSWERLVYADCENGVLTGVESSTTRTAGVALDHPQDARIAFYQQDRLGNAFSGGDAGFDQFSNSDPTCAPNGEPCTEAADCCSLRCNVFGDKTCLTTFSFASNLMTVTHYVLPSELLVRAQTFMHELGHTLGLRHGGFESFNRKPNYFSAMNAAYDVAGFLDYSDGSRPTLDATDLVERSVILDTELWPLPVRYDCFGQLNQQGISNQPIDWTCDGSLEDACTQQDPCLLTDRRFREIRDQQGNVVEILELYTRSLDWDDWGNIDFRGGVTGLQALEFPLIEPPGDESPIEVIIDVRPGSTTNPVNIKSRGVLPVGIPATPIFDPTTLFPSSISLAESQGGPLVIADRCHAADFNEDEFDDLVCHFRTRPLELSAKTERMTLHAQGLHQAIVGSDEVRVVP